MSGLEQFLDKESQAGSFQGTGAFAVDFAKAGERRAKFALPRPELWIIRLLQGLARLQASHVAISQSRQELSVIAQLEEPLGEQLSLTELFRVVNSQDPRAPLLDGVWGALGKGLKLSLEWSQDANAGLMTVAPKQVQVESREASTGPPKLSIRVQPHSPVGVMARFFGVTNYSKEFFEVARCGLMAPFPLTLDGRPCDLLSGFDKAFFPCQEFRAQRAMDGAALWLAPNGQEEVFLPSLAPEGTEPAQTSTGYAFILALSWNSQVRSELTVQWVHDGFFTDQESLWGITSHLQVNLFLPATGLSTDLTGLRLRDTKEKRKRLAELSLWALASLKTLPPWQVALAAEGSEEALEHEVDRLFKRALAENTARFKTPDNFLNAVEQHRNRRLQQMAKWRQWHKTKGPTMGETVIRAEGVPDEQQEAVARWGRFLTYTPRQVLGTKQVPKGPEPKVENFFGDVYIRLR